MHRSLITAALFTAVCATSLFAGPPWISVEMPANPHHASTRGAAMLIRAYHHSTSIAVPVTGVAEGRVDGRRVRMDLDIRPTNIAGVYAVHTALPKNGTWVLAVTLTQQKDVTATALISVDSRGRVVAVDVPSDRTRDGWMVPRALRPADIESALGAVAAAEGAATSVARGPLSAANAGAVALPLLLVGAVLALRRRASA